MSSASEDIGVDGVIITGELNRRPSKAPNHEAEALALGSLAQAMSNSPGSVLQRLVEAARELTRSDSAGVSLLEPGGEQGAFRWAATAGAWAPYRDGVMPREQSPCGEVVARETVLLVKNPERAFPALLQAEPGIGEGLLAPFAVDGETAGTLWVIKHEPDGLFDAEDARVVQSLAKFASAAHQMVRALDTVGAVGRQAEARLQQLFALAETSTEFFGVCDMQYMPLYGNAAALRMVGLTDLEEVKRTPVFEFFFPEDRAFMRDEFFPKVLREGHGKIETRFRHFVTGAPIFVVYSLVVLTDERGQPTSLGTVSHDITDRKRAETVRADSDERLRQFGEASQDVLWIRDAETFQWVYLAPAFETIYGQDRATALRGDNMAG